MPPNGMPAGLQQHFTPVLLEPSATTIYGSLYDNIWLPKTTTAKHNWTGEGGVVAVDYIFYPDTYARPYESPEAKAARQRCNRELSDHRPVWMALKNTDHDGATVERIAHILHKVL